METKGKRRFFGLRHKTNQGAASGRDVEYPHCTCRLIENCGVGFVKCNHPGKPDNIIYCSVLHMCRNDYSYRCPLDVEKGRVPKDKVANR